MQAAGVADSQGLHGLPVLIGSLSAPRTELFGLRRPVPRAPWHRDSVAIAEVPKLLVGGIAACVVKELEFLAEELFPVLFVVPW